MDAHKVNSRSHGQVLVTGANGYIGNAVAKAFSRAGWRTFGLIRRHDDAADLAKNEIQPVVGSPDDLVFLEKTGDTVFDVVVSNTEDRRDPGAHFTAVAIMLDEIARCGRQAGVRPLMMFTSGCKDYGAMSETAGKPGLAPHTESSALNPPVPLAPRALFGAALLRGKHANYDATVLRPTIVYGHSSSHYGQLFELASESASVLELHGDPDAIMHSVHVDDCADGYVALAEHADRASVAGQAFNISNLTYETAGEIADALIASYGLTTARVAAAESVPTASMHDSVHFLANFSQWVSSEKLRALTGWRERKLDFVKGIEQYRLAYEATAPVIK